MGCSREYVNIQVVLVEAQARPKKRPEGITKPWTGHSSYGITEITNRSQHRILVLLLMNLRLAVLVQYIVVQYCFIYLTLAGSLVIGQ
jgi:hypothetical protein